MTNMLPNILEYAHEIFVSHFSFVILTQLLFCGVLVYQARPENDLTKMPRSSFKNEPCQQKHYILPQCPKNG